jgi:uncharacterized protein YcbK (DUF882 family)
MGTGPAAEAGGLTLVNASTRERLSIVFVRRRRDDPAALRRLAHVFRDRREGEVLPIGPELFDTLSETQRRLGGGPILLTCGFRTAETNRMVGGVGFYPVRRFCHVDVGPVRARSGMDVRPGRAVGRAEPRTLSRRLK